MIRNIKFSFGKIPKQEKCGGKIKNRNNLGGVHT